MTSVVFDILQRRTEKKYEKPKLESVILYVPFCSQLRKLEHVQGLFTTT